MRVIAKLGLDGALIAASSARAAPPEDPDADLVPTGVDHRPAAWDPNQEDGGVGASAA
jgi:hypothetical protein